MTDKYTALLGKLKEAAGPFEWDKAPKIARSLYLMGDRRYVLLATALRADIAAIGAALELVEMTLPGWRVVLEIDPNSAQLARLLPLGSYEWNTWHGAKTLALAILIAWCEAMIEKERA